MGCERTNTHRNLKSYFTHLLKLCARKNTIQLKVENIQNANNTYKTNKKQQQKRSYFSMSANFATMEYCRFSEKRPLIRSKNSKNEYSRMSLEFKKPRK